MPSRAIQLTIKTINQLINQSIKTSVIVRCEGIVGIGFFEPTLTDIDGGVLSQSSQNLQRVHAAEKCVLVRHLEVRGRVFRGGNDDAVLARVDTRGGEMSAVQSIALQVSTGRSSVTRK